QVASPVPDRGGLRVHLQGRPGMTLLITLLAVTAYLACYVTVAGKHYARLRPYTEPLRCRGRDGRYHEHDSYCYRRPGYSVDTKNEALGLSMVLGFLGPLAVIAMILMAEVKKFDHPVIEEVRAQNKRKEKELGLDHVD